MSLGCGPTTRRNTEDQDTLGFAYHVLCLAICPHMCCVCVYVCICVCLCAYSDKRSEVSSLIIFRFFFFLAESFSEPKTPWCAQAMARKNLRILLSPPSRTVHRHESPHSVFIIVYYYFYLHGSKISELSFACVASPLLTESSHNLCPSISTPRIPVRMGSAGQRIGSTLPQKPLLLLAGTARVAGPHSLLLVYLSHMDLLPFIVLLARLWILHTCNHHGPDAGLAQLLQHWLCFFFQAILHYEKSQECQLGLHFLP